MIPQDLLAFVNLYFFCLHEFPIHRGSWKLEGCIYEFGDFQSWIQQISATTAICSCIVNISISCYIKIV